MHPPHDNPPTAYFEGLLARLRAGDETAWPPLLASMQHRLIARARALLRQRHLTGVEADDVAHEVTLRLRRYREGEARWVGDLTPDVRRFWGLMGRIVENVVSDLRRRRRVRKGRGGDGPAPAVEEIVGADLPGELLAEAKEREGVLSGLIRELDEQDRDLILLHDFSGLTFAEIAPIYSWTVNKTASRYYTARRRLGQLILDRGLRPEDLL